MIKLTSGRTNGRNFLLICISLLFLLQKHHCQFLPKQAANLKKQQNNLLSNNNYNVKRLKTVRGFLEEFKSKQLELAKSSRKTQKSIYFHQVRKMWELTAKTNKTLSSSYYIKMANIFRYGKEGGQNESISRSTNCSGASL